MKTIPEVLGQYKTLLTKLDKLEEEHKAKVNELTSIRTKMEAWLGANATDIDPPEWLIEQAPITAWKIGKKADGLAVQLHMLVDDGILPEYENALKAKCKPLKDLLEEIEVWSLAQLLERKSKNFSSDMGTASLRTDTKYQIVDKKLFVDWAKENQAESELTITLRPNSKFMAKVVEDAGELPQGVSSFREQKCVFTKK